MEKREGWACRGWGKGGQWTNKGSKEFPACGEKRKGNIGNVETF